jgi:integrase/recombinase XerC
MRIQRAALAYVEERTKQGRFRGRTPQNVTDTLFRLASAIPDTDLLTKRRLEKWTQRGVALSTAKTELSCVRAFCDWLVEKKVLRTNPCAGIPTPRQPRSVPRSLQTDRVEKLFANLPDSRAFLIVSLMVQEGLRCAEVAALEAGSIDFTERTLLVVGKGGHERVLPISDETWYFLHRYLESYPLIGGPLIRSYHDSHKGITGLHIGRMVSGWMKDAGIKARPHDGVAAHSLRHTMATDVLRNGGNIRDVQVALGHTSLATTQRYLNWSVSTLRTALGGRSYRPA